LTDCEIFEGCCNHAPLQCGEVSYKRFILVVAYSPIYSSTYRHTQSVSD